MLFEDFQQGIVDRVLADTWFTTAPAVVILPEEDPDELTDEELALIRVRATEALAAGGVVGIVSEPDYQSVDNSPDMFEFTVTLAFFENRKKNRKASTGCRRSSRDALLKAHGQLQRYRIPFENSAGDRVDPFQFLRISAGEYVGEEDGIRVRALVVKSYIALATISAALANEDDLILVTENNEPLSSEG